MSRMHLWDLSDAMQKSVSEPIYYLGVYFSTQRNFETKSFDYLGYMYDWDEWPSGLWSETKFFNQRWSSFIYNLYFL